MASPATTPSRQAPKKMRRHAAQKAQDAWVDIAPGRIQRLRAVAAMREAEVARAREAEANAEAAAAAARAAAEAARREAEAAEVARAEQTAAETRRARKARKEAKSRRRELLDRADLVQRDWDAFAVAHGLPVPAKKTMREGWTTDATGQGKQVLMTEMNDLVCRTEAVLGDASRELQSSDFAASAEVGNFPFWYASIVEKLSPYTAAASSLR